MSVLIQHAQSGCAASNGKFPPLLTIILGNVDGSLGPLRTFVDGAANGSKEPKITKFIVHHFARVKL